MVFHFGLEDRETSVASGGGCGLRLGYPSGLSSGDGRMVNIFTVLMKYFCQLDLRLSAGVSRRQRLCCHPRSRTGGRLEDLGGCGMFRQQPLYL